MDETIRQIETHIETTRDALGANLDELERKVESAVDWRQHFDRQPWMMMALAFGTGVLLSATLRDRGRGRPALVEARSFGAGTGRRKHTAFDEAWRGIKSAVTGAAAIRFKGYVDQMLPGFREQLDLAQARTAQDSDSGSQGSAGPTRH